MIRSKPQERVWGSASDIPHQFRSAQRGAFRNPRCARFPLDCKFAIGDRCRAGVRTSEGSPFRELGEARDDLLGRTVFAVCRVRGCADGHRISSRSDSETCLETLQAAKSQVRFLGSLRNRNASAVRSDQWPDTHGIGHRSG